MFDLLSFMKHKARSLYEVLKYGLRHSFSTLHLLHRLALRWCERKINRFGKLTDVAIMCRIHNTQAMNRLVDGARLIRGNPTATT
jgi:hypothetical protein